MKKIAVVDDEKALVGLVALHLQMAGFEVHTAYDGEAAIDLVRVAKPDLVILDVMLPYLDGWEVCRSLRRSGFNRPIIMLTACVQEEGKRKALDAGANEYVTKPFSPRELISRVRSLLVPFAAAGTALRECSP